MASDTRYRKISATKNYRLFERSTENRPLDPKKHRKLMDSMKRYGFLKCFPIVCYRDSKGHLVVKDGQHRLAIAEGLNLPVFWVEEEVDFDVAIVNSTAKVWGLKDYAQKFAANGKKDYQEGLDFAEEHHLPIGTAFSLLAGTTSFDQTQSGFVDGTFKIRDRKWADEVAGIYGPLVSISPALRNARFIEACMCVCRVSEFEPVRLIKNAERCRDKLVSYSTRDAYLDMIEEVYNFHHSKLLGLKVAATMAMRNRSAVNRNGTKRKNGKVDAA